MAPALSHWGGDEGQSLQEKAREKRQSDKMDFVSY